MLARSVVSSEGPTGDSRLPSSCGCQQDSGHMGCQLRALVSCWLLAGSHPQLPAVAGQQLLSDPCTRASLTFPLRGSQPASKTDNAVSCHCSHARDTLPPSLSSVGWNTSRSCPRSRGDGMVAGVPGGQDNLDPLRVCSPQRVRREARGHWRSVMGHLMVVAASSRTKQSPNRAHGSRPGLVSAKRSPHLQTDTLHVSF